MARTTATPASTRHRVAVALIAALIAAVAALVVVLVVQDDNVANGASVSEILTAPDQFEGRSVTVRGEVTAVGVRGIAIATPGSRPESLLVVPLAGPAPPDVREGQGVEVTGIVRPYREGSLVLPPKDGPLGRQVEDDAALLATSVDPV